MNADGNVGTNPIAESTGKLRSNCGFEIKIFEKPVRPEPENDTEREIQEAVIDKTDDVNRDLVHGDGGTEGLPIGERDKR